jgi:hypothetical protein
MKQRPDFRGAVFVSKIGVGLNLDVENVILELAAFILWANWIIGE